MRETKFRIKINSVKPAALSFLNTSGLISSRDRDFLLMFSKRLLFSTQHHRHGVHAIFEFFVGFADLSSNIS